MVDIRLAFESFDVLQLVEFRLGGQRTFTSEDQGLGRVHSASRQDGHGVGGEWWGCVGETDLDQL